jgi:putative ABC transport system permease protein
VKATVYHPLDLARTPGSALFLAVRSGGSATPLAPTLRRIAGTVNPALLLDIQTLDGAIADDTRFWRSCGRLLLVVSVIALLLSLAGIYSVMSFTVARRTREIGVRVALGAHAARVVAETFRRPIRLVAGGVAAGCIVVGALAALLVHALTNQRWEPQQFDDMALLSGIAVLVAFCLAMLAVCALACIGPTLRALRVQPSVALSADA